LLHTFTAVLSTYNHRFGAIEFKEYIAHSKPRKQKALAGKALKDNFNNFDNSSRLKKTSFNKCFKFIFFDWDSLEYWVHRKYISLFQLNKACNNTQFFWKTIERKKKKQVLPAELEKLWAFKFVKVKRL